MSSTLETINGDWLSKPILDEFQAWIKDDIRWRLDAMGYSDLVKSEDLNDAINKCLNEHTNKDYLECSDNFTKALENLFVSFNIKTCDAIRLAWKWSD